LFYLVQVAARQDLVQETAVLEREEELSQLTKYLHLPRLNLEQVVAAHFNQAETVMVVAVADLHRFI
tara:strand:+ start:69 stop:269 length:201 start_codon:yes stop_codon:yes gene_type:complete